MTKEELKAYISEAVDALDPVDLEVLFPPNNQPDLYSIIEELTSLKGTVSKLSGSTLKLNHEIHSLVEQVGVQQEQQANFLLTLQEEETPIEEEVLDTDLKYLLNKLLEMDEVLQLATNSYRALPVPTFFSLGQYKAKIAAWQKGFDITLNRWQKLLQSTNLYKTGLIGEIFNPELHEVVAVKHQNDKTDNIILETEQAGFLYKGKVIKVAKVVVNKVKIIKPTILEPVPIIAVKPEEKIALETVEQKQTTKNIIQKTKPKPKRKKGKGGRRKKRKRNRK